MSRTPLVLVHGNPETAAIWGPLIGQLDRADAVVLSPPGFGVPAPHGFDSSMTGYRDWLASQLELFRAPVDLMGHDWGGIHVAALAMSRPDLVRSWASDALACSRRTTSGTRGHRCGSRRARARPRCRSCGEAIWSSDSR